ncbi:hypothetical protein Acr_00g0074400 [Actinidia rufa]|uniref:Uncharacterized protein n=1 Tax=Actinidia rufa TaxID=165716 RepID=A0A7J0DSD4_9ERIC|nr:hypothetical protein Acr_00g0074400 [Actinidia rufa]
MVNRKQNAGATTCKVGQTNTANNGQELTQCLSTDTSPNPQNPQGQNSQTDIMEQICIVSENMATMQQTQRVFTEIMLATQYCLNSIPMGPPSSHQVMETTRD